MGLLVPFKSATKAHTCNTLFLGRQSRGDKLSVKSGSKLIKFSQGLKETCQHMDLEDIFSVRSLWMGVQDVDILQKPVHMMTDQEFVYPYELVEKKVVKYICMYIHTYTGRYIIFFVIKNITRKPKDLP
jgi:hypothetical protein